MLSRIWMQLSSSHARGCSDEDGKTAVGDAMKK